MDSKQIKDFHEKHHIKYDIIPVTPKETPTFPLWEIWLAVMGFMIIATLFKIWL